MQFSFLVRFSFVVRFSLKWIILRTPRFLKSEFLEENLLDDLPSLQARSSRLPDRDNLRLDRILPAYYDIIVDADVMTINDVLTIGHVIFDYCAQLHWCYKYIF